MKFKAIIFDYDGLMFDTEKIWQDYFFQANEVFKTNFTEEDRVQTIGKNEQEIRKTMKVINPNLDVDAYRDWMRNKAYEHFYKLGANPKKGLIELLSFAKANNIKIAIASGSEKDLILSVLKREKINANMFLSIVTGDRKIKPKPNPDVFLKACEELNVDPNEAIVLEDSYNGVKAGKNAGCFTIMIPDTMPATKEMKQTANLILSDLNEVVDFLTDKI